MQDKARHGEASIDREALEAAMRALVQTIAPARRLPDGAARLVSALQSFLGTDFEIGGLAPIDDAELATRLVDPWVRQQLVRVLVAGALIDGAPSRAQLERIRAIAAALDVAEPGIIDLELYLRRRRWRLRRHLLARFWAIERIAARIAERGFWRTVLPAVLATIFGRFRDRRLAARFATLRQLPAGTLGRNFIAYLEANRFALPGEIGAVSDIIVAHDLAHVLGDYRTTPPEEVLVACFSAGHRVKDPFAMVLFVMFQFHLGLRMTPAARAEVGCFDPARALEAIARGAAVNVDLTGEWDYWPLMAEPLESVRRRLGITPRHRDALDTYGRAA